MFNILGSIVIGFIAGLIARALLPGTDSMGFWMTTIIGIVGSILGGFIGTMISKPAPDAKFHPAGLLMSVVGAMVVLFAMRFIR